MKTGMCKFMKKLKKKLKKTSKELSEIVVKTAEKLSKLSLDDSVEFGSECVVEDNVIYQRIVFTFPIFEVEIDERNNFK